MHKKELVLSRPPSPPSEGGMLRRLWHSSALKDYGKTVPKRKTRRLSREVVAGTMERFVVRSSRKAARPKASDAISQEQSPISDDLDPTMHDAGARVSADFDWDMTPEGEPVEQATPDTAQTQATPDRPDAGTRSDRRTDCRSPGKRRFHNYRWGRSCDRRP